MAFRPPRTVRRSAHKIPGYNTNRISQGSTSSSSNKSSPNRGSSANSNENNSTALSAVKAHSSGSTKQAQARQEAQENDNKHYDARQPAVAVAAAAPVHSRQLSVPSTHNDDDDQQQQQGNNAQGTQGGLVQAHFYQQQQQMTWLQQQYQLQQQTFFASRNGGFVGTNNSSVSAVSNLDILSRVYQNTMLVRDCLAHDLHQVLGQDPVCPIPFVPLPSVRLYDELMPLSPADMQRMYYSTTVVDGQTKVVPVKTCQIFVGQLPLVCQPFLDETGSVFWLRWLISLSGVKPLKAEVRRGHNHKKASIGIVTVPEDKADMVIAFLHKRCLVTQTGVYIAVTRDQIKVMHSFCYDMLLHKNDARFQHRVYTPLTVSREIPSFIYQQNNKKPELYNPLCTYCDAIRDQLCPLEIRGQNERTTPFGYLFNVYLPIVTSTMQSHQEQMASHAYICDEVLYQHVPEEERRFYTHVKPDTMRICNEKALKFWSQRGGAHMAMCSTQFECVCDLHLTSQVMQPQQAQQQSFNQQYYY